MLRSPRVNGVASASSVEEPCNVDQPPVLIVSFCGSTAAAGQDCLLVLRFMVPEQGLQSSEHASLQREAQSIIPKLRNEFLDARIVPPENWGEIPFYTLELVHRILSQCGARWRRLLLVCGNSAEERGAAEQRSTLRTVALQEVLLHQRLRFVLPELPNGPVKLAKDSPRTHTQDMVAKLQARLKTAEHKAESLRTKLASLSRTLTTIHTHLFGLASLLAKERERFEEHQHVLQHQFAVMLEGIIEREMALTELYEESHRWSLLSPAELVHVSQRIDAGIELASEDSAITQMLHHFDQRSLGLVENAFLVELGVISMPKTKTLAKPEKESWEVLGDIITEISLALFEASHHRQDHHALSVWPPSDVGFQTCTPSSTRTDDNGTQDHCRSANSRQRAQKTLPLLRRMLWHASQGMPEPGYIAATSARARAIRENMAAALKKRNSSCSQSPECNALQEPDPQPELPEFDGSISVTPYHDCETSCQLNWSCKKHSSCNAMLVAARVDLDESTAVVLARDFETACPLYTIYSDSEEGEEGSELSEHTVLELTEFDAAVPPGSGNGASSSTCFFNEGALQALQSAPSSSQCPRNITSPIDRHDPSPKRTWRPAPAAPLMSERIQPGQILHVKAPSSPRISGKNRPPLMRRLPTDDL